MTRRVCELPQHKQGEGEARGASGRKVCVGGGEGGTGTGKGTDEM